MKIILSCIIFASDIIISRYLGVATKGQYFFLITLILTVGNLLTAGLHLGNLYYSKTTPIQQLGFQSIFYIVGLGTILFLVGLPLSSNLPVIREHDFALRAIFITCLFFESAWMIFAYFYVAMNNLYQYAKIPVLRRGIFFLAVCTAFIFTEPSLKLALTFYLIATVLSFLYMMRKFPWDEGQEKFRLSLLWKSLKYGCRSQALVMADDFTLRFNVILLGLWANPTQNGLYSVALNLGQGFPVLAVTLATVIQSAVSLSLEQQLRQLEKLFRHTAFLLFLGGITLVLLAKPLINYAYGKEFLAATPLVQLLVPGMVSFALYVLIGRFFLTNGRPGIGFGCSVAGLLVNIGLGLYLIPQKGAIGAVQALQAGYICSAILFLISFCVIYNVNLINLVFLKKEDLVNLVSRLKYFFDFIFIRYYRG